MYVLNSFDGHNCKMLKLTWHLRNEANLIKYPGGKLILTEFTKEMYVTHDITYYNIKNEVGSLYSVFECSSPN